MENFETSFLKDKYWGKKEFRDVVEESTEKKQRLTEEDDFQVPQKPGEKIPNYLERLERVTERVDPKTGERGKLFLETSLYSKYVIKPENISDEYVKGILLGNFAEQRGYERDTLKNEEIKQHVLAQFKQETGQDFANYLIPKEELERVRNMVVTDQKTRMNTWFEYLTSEEAHHAPAAFRYWAFAEMLKLGSFDEERKVFNRRTENTAASFPELDQQALALVFDEVQRKRKGEPSQLQATNSSNQAQFRRLLQSEDFGRLYAFSLEHVNSLRLPTERLIITKGQWQQFPKGTPASKLTPTLQGFNTKWCIAGEGYAQDYLSKSDIWIYFSEDVDGQNSIPRACIVDSGEQGITEVRGIMSSEEAKQHLDSYITPVVAEKLKAMPGGEKWQSTMEDMKRLARTHFKHLQNESLNKEDLVFLYEIDKSIQSSGYQRDPRIEQLRKTRNTEADALTVFECTPDEIAHSIDQINPGTKAYIGKLEPGIFDKLPENVEHIYTSFPEGKIRRFELEIGGKTKDQLQEQIQRNGMKIYSYAKSMMENPDFTTSTAPEQMKLVRLQVKDLGFSNNPTTDQLYERAQKLGLELCPAGVGPNYRLSYKDQPMGEWVYVGMKPISGSRGYPSVFSVGRNGDGLWLSYYWTSPDSKWPLDYQFVFALRKKS